MKTAYERGESEAKEDIIISERNEFAYRENPFTYSDSGKTKDWARGYFSIWAPYVKSKKLETL